MSLIREHLCGYDLNLTYPQLGGTLPSLQINPAPGGSSKAARNILTRRLPVKRLLRVVSDSIERMTHLRHKRQPLPPMNGIIDPEYGCDLFDEALHFALDNSPPWSESAVKFISGLVRLIEACLQMTVMHGSL